MTEKKIKIIYGITKSNWGGAQRYVYDLATALPKDQYNVACLVGTAGELSEKLHQAQVRTIVLENLNREINIWQDTIALFKLIKIFRREKPDIIHLNSSKMGFLGAIAGKIARVPKIIFTGHGWAFNEDRGQLQKKLIYLLHSLTIRLSDRTIAVSEKTREQITQNKSLNKKTFTVRNGIGGGDFLEQNEAREKILERLPTGVETGDRPWIGTISELHKNKGLKYLIEAIHLLKLEQTEDSPFPLIIIIGDGENKEKLQERIDRYKLQDSVFLVGRMDEAAKYLKAFDIFTLTSITEALPYVILEAGLAERPVVASAVGGIPEIIEDMRSGILVRSKEPVEIGKALNFFFRYPEKMALFSHNLRQKIETEFSQEKMVRETLALYRSQW